MKAVPSGNYLPVRDDWLALRSEAIIEPELPIVDAHHHFYDRPGWFYGPDEFLGDTRSGHNIRATVFMQAQTRVYVKLGGLGMRINGFGFEKGDTPPSSADLVKAWKPWMQTCIEAFGADRCMFESNFPVDKGSYAYAIGWNAFKSLTSAASASERSALFSGTASQLYRLS